MLYSQKKLRFQFSVVDANLAPPPPPPLKIFARAYALPETGMDFGLAFVTPRSQTVNDKRMSAGEIDMDSMDSG